MKLYKENAKNLVGRRIDRHHRMFGCYPMTVIELNGELYTKDACGVCSPIPERETDFNCVSFDFVLGEKE